MRDFVKSVNLVGLVSKPAGYLFIVCLLVVNFVVALTGEQLVQIVLEISMRRS